MIVKVRQYKIDLMMLENYITIFIEESIKTYNGTISFNPLKRIWSQTRNHNCFDQRLDQHIVVFMKCATMAGVVTVVVFMTVSSTFGWLNPLQPYIRKCCDAEKRFITMDGVVRCARTGKLSTFNISSLLLYVNSSSVRVQETQFGVIYGDVCINGKFHLDPSTNAEDTNYITPRGHVFLPGIKGDGDLYYDTSNYCLDKVDDNEHIHTFLCVAASNEVAKFTLRIQEIGMILSSPLLLATLIIYAVLPDLRNLPGKCLMCNVASMLTAYLALPVLQVTGAVLPQIWCVSLGKFIEYSVRNRV